MVATASTTVRLAVSINNAIKNLDTVRLVVLMGIMVMVMIVSLVQTNVKVVLIKPRAQYVKQDIGVYHVRMIVLCSVQSAPKMGNVYLVSLVFDRNWHKSLENYSIKGSKKNAKIRQNFESFFLSQFVWFARSLFMTQMILASLYYFFKYDFVCR